MKQENLLRGKLSKSGLATLTECGGSMSNTASCRLIATRYYNAMKPIHVFSRGELSNLDHAVFVVKEGMIVLEGDKSHGDTQITISRIVKITPTLDGYCDIELEKINSFAEGDWETVLPSEAVKFVAAAHDKMSDYHCRRPYWFINERDEK